MTELLYHFNSLQREFKATVTHVIGNGVVLDKTAFYPGGGGQPNDIGELENGSVSWQVTKVGRKENYIIHELSGIPPEIGTSIRGTIDWVRRYQLMRTHTALHMLCGIVWRDYQALVTGGDMQPLQARMDFELESMTADLANEMVRKVNKEILAKRDVTSSTLPRKEAFAIPDLIRTKINLLPQGIREIRVVNIEGLDLQADGGTHVGNTAEVKQVYLIGHQSKGKINKRIRIRLED